MDLPRGDRRERGRAGERRGRRGLAIRRRGRPLRPRRHRRGVRRQGPARLVRTAGASGRAGGAADRRLGPAHPRRQPRRGPARARLRRRRRGTRPRVLRAAGGGRGPPRRRAPRRRGRGSSGSVGAAVPQVVDGVARVVSWAPVAGQGPTGSLGWAVVVEQSVDELVAPDARYRTPGNGLRGDPDPRRPRRVRLDLAARAPTAGPPRGRGRASRLRRPEPSGAGHALRRGRPDRPRARTASTPADRPTGRAGPARTSDLPVPGQPGCPADPRRRRRPAGALAADDGPGPGGLPRDRGGRRSVRLVATRDVPARRSSCSTG